VKYLLLSLPSLFLEGKGQFDQLRNLDPAQDLLVNPELFSPMHTNDYWIEKTILGLGQVYWSRLRTLK